MHTTRLHVSWIVGLLASLMFLAPVARAQTLPASQPTATADADHAGQAPTSGPAAHHPVVQMPSLVATIPFITILLCIALLPLIPPAAHWWHPNRNKLLVAAVLSIIVLTYYFARGTGLKHDGDHLTDPGWPTMMQAIRHAVLDEYIPFIVLLFSLYTISGGISLRGDLRATPSVNAAFLGIGALLASFIGTTGASMVLIRPLLQTNKERHYVTHTVIFFIFLVSNVGGCLLPIGDPPLFLGYLRGVPFLWTFRLIIEWAFCSVLLLAIYYVWDMRLYKKEPAADHLRDETRIEPLHLRGKLNIVWLLGVVLAVALLVPSKPLLGTAFIVPDYLREVAQLVFVGLAWITTPARIRTVNEFNFSAIGEVAVLFIGIFITMQAPIEILKIKGPELGLTTPVSFFWASGILSSFLDNAPTYAVFFETANSLTNAPGHGIIQLLDGSYMRENLLIAISLGSVFMGANTYIGNGPNFMVKSIAEQSGVKMPSFFGYMLYSVGILIPLFLLVTVLFVR